MTDVEASSFPSVFKEGWLRLNKKVPFLSGADGVVSRFQQKIRCASRISIRRLRDLLITTPSAPLRNGLFLLMAQPPLLENGGEWTRLPNQFSIFIRRFNLFTPSKSREKSNAE
jgi:hypothetical protein